MKNLNIENVEEAVTGVIQGICCTMLQDSRRLITTGALDLNKYEGREVELAKILVASVMKDHADDFALTDSMKKEVRNLRKF